MLFTIIVVALFVFKAPSLVWLSIPICLIYLILKGFIKKGLPRHQNHFDEFDLWQDNQGC